MLMAAGSATKVVMSMSLVIAATACFCTKIADEPNSLGHPHIWCFKLDPHLAKLHYQLSCYQTDCSQILFNTSLRPGSLTSHAYTLTPYRASFTRFGAKGGKVILPNQNSLCAVSTSRRKSSNNLTRPISENSSHFRSNQFRGYAVERKCSRKRA